MLLHPLDELQLLVVVRNQGNASLGFGHVYPIFSFHPQDTIDADRLIHKRFRSQLRMQGSPLLTNYFLVALLLNLPVNQH